MVGFVFKMSLHKGGGGEWVTSGKDDGTAETASCPVSAASGVTTISGQTARPGCDPTGTGETVPRAAVLEVHEPLVPHCLFAIGNGRNRLKNLYMSPSH